VLKAIENYTGYFISDDGKVYCNLGKGNRNKDRTVPLYEVKPRLTKHGYARIYARNVQSGKRTDLYVHRLVAEYFLPNPSHLKYVNHKNCIRDDNDVKNLEWCTAKENTDQTARLRHIVRGKDGRYESNFTYEIV
jgi:hypothetical protein